MATTELTSATDTPIRPGQQLTNGSHRHHRWLPEGLFSAWLHVYAAVWVLTISFAAIVVLVDGGALRLPVRRVLGLELVARRNPPADLVHVLALGAHNISILTWPLLLGVIGAHRNRLATHIADGLLSVSVAINTLQVGIALGAYGTRLLAYLPHLPFEWAALALGASSWVLQRRRALTLAEGVGVLALTASIVLCSAILETVVVPHR